MRVSMLIVIRIGIIILIRIVVLIIVLISMLIVSRTIVTDEFAVARAGVSVTTEKRTKYRQASVTAESAPPGTMSMTSPNN